MKNIFRNTTKEEMKIRGGILLAVLALNLICQIFAGFLEELNYVSWVFFLSNVMFFTLEEQNTRKKFFMVLCGSIFGLAAAAFLIWLNTVLVSMGIGAVISVMIPLALVLTMTIMLNPVCPVVFNNCAFAYFIVALIDPTPLGNDLCADIIWTVIGHLVVNGLCLLVISRTTSR